MLDGPSSENIKIDVQAGNRGKAPVQVGEADSRATTVGDNRNTAAHSQGPQVKKKLRFEEEQIKKLPQAKDQKEEMKYKLCIKHKKSNKMTKRQIEKGSLVVKM